jgi:hypothetical protein
MQSRTVSGYFPYVLEQGKGLVMILISFLKSLSPIRWVKGIDVPEGLDMDEKPGDMDDIKKKSVLGAMRLFHFRAL